MRARTRQLVGGVLHTVAAWGAAVGSLALIVGWSLTATALPLSSGDVLVGLGSTAGASGRGAVRHFSPDGTLLETLITTSGSFEETGMCLDAAHTLYTTNFDANSMSTFDASGLLSHASFGTGFNEHPNSCTVDAVGRIYVGQSDKDGDFGGGGLLMLDTAGALLAMFGPAPDQRGTDWVDLMADQCTLVYTSAGTSIKRFDVCADLQLPDFCSTCDDGAGAVTTGPLFGLRLLPDRGVLVADWNAGTGTVRRYDASGNQVRAYTVVNAFGALCGASGTAPCFFPWALALDPDRKSFWVADHLTGEIFKLALDDGTVLTQFVGGKCDDPHATCAVTGLGIAGEPTAAAIAAGPITVTATITAAAKPYDGTTAATITGCTLSGVVGADAVSCLASGGAFATASAGTGKPVTATVSLTGAAAGSYVLASSAVTTVGSIAPAPASVMPSPASKVYGTPDPALTGTVSGFLPADGVTATYDRTEGENVADGPYAISATLSPTEVLGNYAITYGTADFVIAPAVPVVTWADPADIVYPTPLGAAQLDATANVPGTFAFTPAAGTVLEAGNGQLLSVLFTPTDGSNYTTGSAQAHINVLPPASCPTNPDATLTLAVDDTGTPHGSVPVYTTVQAAYDAARSGDVIGMFSQTTENVTLGGAKSLTIAQCTTARMTAADPFQPVWNVTSTGVLTIIGPEAVGGSVGWRIASGRHVITSISAAGASEYGLLIAGDGNTVSVNSVSGSSVGVRIAGNNNDVLPGGVVSGNSGNGVEVATTATGNTLRIGDIESNGANGIQLDGSANTVSIDGHVDSNGMNGVLVNGSNNTIQGITAGSNKGKGNGQDGLKIVGNGNRLDRNTVNANGQVGFDIVGSGNTLEGNRAAQSQSGKKENTGCEYRFADGTTVDLGGNRKDTASFGGGLPGPRYAAGCYE